MRKSPKYRGYGHTVYIDEVFVKISGKQHYLWRAVDQDGEVVDVYLQAKRSKFCLLMRLSLIYSTGAGTSSGLNTIGISGQVRTANGAGPLPELRRRASQI